MYKFYIRHIGMHLKLFICYVYVYNIIMFIKYIYTYILYLYNTCNIYKKYTSIIIVDVFYISIYTYAFI